jgi:DNA-directed RNA polymerase subunit RPC12/RpoP
VKRESGVGRGREREVETERECEDCGSERLAKWRGASSCLNLNPNP